MTSPPSPLAQFGTLWPLGLVCRFSLGFSAGLPSLGMSGMSHATPPLLDECGPVVVAGGHEPCAEGAWVGLGSLALLSRGLKWTLLT